MNIIEACKALRESKKVKLKYFPEDAYFGVDDSDRLVRLYKSDVAIVSYPVTLNMMMSNDWEIYEEQSPMEKAWRQIDNQGVWMSEHVKDLAKTHFENGWNAATKHFTEK